MDMIGGEERKKKEKQEGRDNGIHGGRRDGV